MKDFEIATAIKAGLPAGKADAWMAALSAAITPRIDLSAATEQFLSWLCCGYVLPRGLYWPKHVADALWNARKAQDGAAEAVRMAGQSIEELSAAVGEGPWGKHEAFVVYGAMADKLLAIVADRAAEPPKPLPNVAEIMAKAATDCTPWERGFQARMLGKRGLKHPPVTSSEWEDKMFHKGWCEAEPYVPKANEAAQ